MIVSFWSVYHGQARTTCSMISLAIEMLREGKKNGLITQAHYSMNNLELPFFGSRDIKENEKVMSDIGLSALFASFMAEPLSKEAVERCSASILPNLSLLPGYFSGDLGIFKQDMSKMFKTILRLCNELYDYVFVDTPSGKNDIAQQTIEYADIVVVCLNQDIRLINQFFKDYDFWKTKKVFFIIGDYDHTLTFNYHYLISKVKQLNKKNTAVIPYCSDFRDSLYRGMIQEFFLLQNHEGLTRKDKNFDFFFHVQDANRKISNFMNAGKREVVSDESNIK